MSYFCLSCRMLYNCCIPFVQARRAECLYLRHIKKSSLLFFLQEERHEERAHKGTAPIPPQRTATVALFFRLPFLHRDCASCSCTLNINILLRLPATLVCLLLWLARHLFGRSRFDLHVLDNSQDTMMTRSSALPWPGWPRHH